MAYTSSAYFLEAGMRFYDTYRKVMCYMKMGYSICNPRYEGSFASVASNGPRVEKQIYMLQVMPESETNTDGVFDCDIVSFLYHEKTVCGVVGYDPSLFCWVIQGKNHTVPLHEADPGSIRVLGNTFENPDLVDRLFGSHEERKAI